MSRDVFEMVLSMDTQGLEWQLAMQCAPLLLGKKISNLVMLPSACKAGILNLLRNSDLSCFILRASNHKVTMLVYREKALADYIVQPEIMDILKKEGYPENCLDMLQEENEKNLPVVSDSRRTAKCLAGILTELRRRYEECRSGEGGFPHEMGIFLGYPAEDVIGFIQNRGRNFLYSGYWKVYGNVEEKKKIFETYEEARDTVVRMLHDHWTLPDIVSGKAAVPA